MYTANNTDLDGFNIRQWHYVDRSQSYHIGVIGGTNLKVMVMLLNTT